MRTTLFLLTITLGFSVFAQKNVTIKGTFISKPAETSISISDYVNPQAFQQNTEIKDMDFSIEFPMTAKEGIYKLSLNAKNYLALVIRPGEKISLKLNPSQLGSVPVIKGSTGSEFVYSTEAALSVFQIKQDSINNAYSILPQTPEMADKRKELENLYYRVEDQKSEFLAGLLLKNPSTLANLFFIDRLDISKYYPVYEKIDSALQIDFKDLAAVSGLHSKVNGSKTTRIGAKMPDIKLPSPQGDSISLYSIKAKIIIIDFWASWCKPCRGENPNMVRIYKDFHDKGLEIFGVSLDKDKTSWQTAIADDKLVWKQVSDLKYWNAAPAKVYGVSSIPSMFILDGDFKLIAKNLRGEELYKFIQSKLK